MRWSDLKEVINPTTELDNNSSRVDRVFHFSRRTTLFCNTAQYFLIGFLVTIFVLFTVADWLKIPISDLIQYYTVVVTVLLIACLIILRILLTFLNQSLQGLRGLSAVNHNKPFILFLRSFQTETSLLSDILDLAIKAPVFIVKIALRFVDESLSSLVPLRRRKRDISYYLPTLSSVPVVSVGAKTTRWGTPKLLMKDDSWEESVQSLIQQASLVVFVPLDTNATVREFGWVNEDSLSKTIFIMMPKPMTRLMFSYRKRWGSFSNLVIRDAFVPHYNQLGNIFLLRNSQAMDRRKGRKSDVFWDDYYDEETLAALISQVEQISTTSPIQVNRSRKHAERLKNLSIIQDFRVKRHELPFQ